MVIERNYHWIVISALLTLPYFNFNILLTHLAHVRNFRKHSRDHLADHGFPYDLMSVMHYREFAFSKNKQPTIMPRRPVPYLRCRGSECPSDLDVKKINYLYQCSDKNENDYFGGNSLGANINIFDDDISEILGGGARLGENTHSGQTYEAFSSQPRHISRPPQPRSSQSDFSDECYLGFCKK